MTSVMGLDLSTTRVGVALPTGRTLSLVPATKAVALRLHFLAAAIAHLVRIYRPQLVVVEGYALHSPGPLSMIRLAELGGCVRRDLHALGVPYVEIPPAQLKSFATGKGNAGKDAMISAALDAGGAPANHDEADAWLARAVGLHAVDGLELPAGDEALLAHRDRVVAAITWPVLAP